MTSVPPGFRGAAMPFEPRLNKTMLRIGKTVHEASRRFDAPLWFVWSLLRAWFQLTVRSMVARPIRGRSSLRFGRACPARRSEQMGSATLDEALNVFCLGLPDCAAVVVRLLAGHAMISPADGPSASAMVVSGSAFHPDARRRGWGTATPPSRYGSRGGHGFSRWPVVPVV